MKLAFGTQLRIAKVFELADEGVIFVEDGNHGEYRPRQNEFADSGIPFLRPPDLKGGRVDFANCGRINDIAFKRIRKGIGQPRDIILTHRATVGRIAIASKDAPSVFVTNPGTTVWRSTNESILDQRYLYCFMRSSAFMDQLWGEVGNNCTFDYVSLTQQRGLRVAIPPLADQKAIAGILGALDEKIDLNRRMNETLEATARAIFKSWFVDFDPVRAKLDGRQPPCMDSDTAALFPDRFDHVDGEPVPKGWPVVPLPEAIEVNPKRTIRKGDVVPYLEMKNMPTIGHRPDEWIDREFKSGTKFINGDTLLARITPCLENGKTAFVDFLDDRQIAYGSTEYIVFRPRPPLPVEFGYYLARSEELRLHAIQNMTGTSGRQRVPPSCFDQFPLPLPPVGIAERFGAIVRPLMQQIAANSQQSKTLATTRDALLPKLLSGKIRVTDAKPVVGDVA